MEVLLARGADASRMDSAGRTALEYARTLGAARAVTRLEGLQK